MFCEGVTKVPFMCLSCYWPTRFLNRALKSQRNDFSHNLRSCPQKIAVVPRSGSRTIKDGMLQKVLVGGLSESLLTWFPHKNIPKSLMSILNLGEWIWLIDTKQNSGSFQKKFLTKVAWIVVNCHFFLQKIQVRIILL